MVIAPVGGGLQLTSIGSEGLAWLASTLRGGGEPVHVYVQHSDGYNLLLVYIASFPGPFFSVQHCMKCWDGPGNKAIVLVCVILLLEK